jgi:hypothetical protein
MNEELQKKTIIDPNANRYQFVATNTPSSLGKICCNNVFHRRDKEGINGDKIK